jgi:hypothetical protein
VRTARALDGAVRIVAEAARTAEGVTASVEPVLVAAASDLARTRDELNLVVIDSRWNGRIALGGPGAGGGPTASALLGDMVRSARRQRLPAPSAAPAIPDRRAHAWAVGVDRSRGAQDTLGRTLERAGINNQRMAWTRDAVAARTEPVPWARVGLAVRALEAQGLAPAVLRVDADA